VKITKFLTARSTVIALFTAISAALLLASAVPQRASDGGKVPAWVGRLPDGLHFLSTLGVDNVVGSAWFAVLVALFWLSLVVSTVSQYGATKALTRRMPSAELPPGSLPLDIPAEQFAERVKAAGYRPAGSADGVQRYVRNLIGYWGNFLLHIGLVTAVVFSLVYVLTQHRVMVRLTGQEITRLTADTVQEIRGVLPVLQALPYSVVLKNLEPRFWGNDKLEYLSSELYFTGQAGGDPGRVDVALSDKSQFGSYLVYQANAFGRAFDIELQTASGETRRQRLYLPFPSRRGSAGYAEQALPGTDYLLKGKFYADFDRKSLQQSQPPLILRLYRGKDLMQEVTLAPGAQGQLGPFVVRLAQSEWWTDILMDGSRGTAGIFAGFAIILIGVLSSYCLVPREIIVRNRDGVLYVQQVVRRFASFYREEFDEITKTVKSEG
jgi:cytochrome c biogenesis protein